MGVQSVLWAIGVLAICSGGMLLGVRVWVDIGVPVFCTTIAGWIAEILSTESAIIAATIISTYPIIQAIIRCRFLVNRICQPVFYQTKVTEKRFDVLVDNLLGAVRRKFEP